MVMYVVYESPFQMISDWPESYRNDPSFRFVKIVPTSWDETKALITIARKKGDDWQLGAMNSQKKLNDEVSLSFLEKGNYIAEIYTDAPDSKQSPKNVTIKTIKVTRPVN